MKKHLITTWSEPNPNDINPAEPSIHSPGCTIWFIFFALATCGVCVRFFLKALI